MNRKLVLDYEYMNDMRRMTQFNAIKAFAVIFGIAMLYATIVFFAFSSFPPHYHYFFD